MRSRHFSGKTVWTIMTACMLAASWMLAPRECSAQRTKTAPAKKDAPGTSDPEPKNRDATKKDGKATKKDAAQKSDPDKKKEMQYVDLETDDGVLIAATYFPSSLGKAAPVVILLHGYGDKQAVFSDLAQELQDRGYAVLAFDFRGHGHSNKLVGNPATTEKRAGPAPSKLDFHDLRTPLQFQSLLQDIEAAKRFLVRRNNAGELNVSKLGVVGCEMGATIGILWAYHDWQYRREDQAQYLGKQGEDVQAIALISPQYNYKGLKIAEPLERGPNVMPPLAFLQSKIPFQIIVGTKDDKTSPEMKKIQTDSAKMADAVKKARPNDADSGLKGFDTKQQGSKLLNPDLVTPEIEREVRMSIVRFFDSTLKTKTARWETREVSEEAGQ